MTERIDVYRALTDAELWRIYLNAVAARSIDCGPVREELIQVLKERGLWQEELFK